MEDIDYEKGAVYQVRFLGTNYESWVNEKKCKKKSLKMFDNPTLEYLSRTPWYYVPLVWWPVILVACCYAFNELGGVLRMALFTIGVLLWIPTEYIVHKYLFHFHPTTPFLISFHFMFHGIHHKTHTDPDRLVMPLLISSGFTCFVASIFYMIFGIYGIGFKVCGTIMAGFGFAYTLYDISHYLMHHKQKEVAQALGLISNSWSSAFRRLRKHHMNHHFANHNKNYGVTTSVMDIICSSNI